MKRSKCLEISLKPKMSNEQLLKFLSAGITSHGEDEKMTVVLNFNIHDSYSYCEDCGCYSNDIITVTCVTHKNFKSFSTGTSAD